MRRFFVAILLGFSLAGLARGDDDLTILRPALLGGIEPGKQLENYLVEQSKIHFDARRKAIAKLKTPDDIKQRNKTLRAKFLAALGELPSEKTPLNAKTTGRDRRDGYSVEKVIYESRPGHHVTALFYLPDGTPPFPGVLVPCGHSINGKAAETYQRISILLAKNGLAALCFDPIGQGERLQVLNSQGKAAVNGSTTEHTLAGIGALLVGRSAAGYRVWDGMRGLDYLASRPEVDPDRLGCTGNSGGGTETAYLMALDDRIRAAAPSCYITSLERLFATIGPQDAEQNITGQVAFGMEHADYLTMRASRPTLMSVGTQDFFDIDGAWTTFREVKNLYGLLGHAERVDIFESNEPHGFTKVRREACMRWMRRWLLEKDDAPTETDFSVAADKDVQCTDTGQVLTAFHGRSVFDLNAEKERALEKSRAERCERQSVEALRNTIRQRLALPERQSILVSNHQLIERDGYTIDTWTLATEPGVVVCDRVFRPQPAGTDRPMVVYVAADPKLGAPGGEIEKRVRTAEHVAMIDPRGMGETTPTGPKRPDNSSQDDKAAFLALLLNRPLLSQRVYDLLQSLRGLESSQGPQRGFHLIADGPAALVALHVAALDDRIKSVELTHGLISWSAVATTPLSRGQLSSVVPGVLEDYDLPDLAAALAPRPLTIRAPLDPAGKPVSQATLDKAYASCRAAYANVNAEDKLSLRAEP
jgi:dienelactone hydrolase